MEKEIKWDEIPVGTLFRAYIRGKKVSGKIQKEDDIIFLCQDEEHGLECNDKLGFQYSYTINDGSTDYIQKNHVGALQLIPDFPSWISSTPSTIKNNRYLLIKK